MSLLPDDHVQGGGFRCLVLDHDDTLVDSTRTVHYPAHRAFMRKYRPLAEPCSLADWFRRNADPGIETYLKGNLGLSEAEWAEEFRIWSLFLKEGHPPFYTPLPRLLRRFTRRGGILCVISNGDEATIRQQYRRLFKTFSVPLHHLQAWHPDPRRRKPSPDPLRFLLKRFDLDPREVLVLDDLPHGLLMAQKLGVPYVWAGWSQGLEEVLSILPRPPDACLRHPAHLERLLGQP